MNGLIRPPRGPELLAQVFPAWLAIVAMLLLTGIGNLIGFRFPDPDDVMRGIQVRDLVAGQGWFDPHQYRLGEGVAMHWSRLVDVPLAAVIVLLSPIFGGAVAERIAFVVVPMLTLLAILFLIARIAVHTVDRKLVWLACFAAAISVPLVAQLQVNRIDHHGWQIACALLAANGLISNNARAGGWLIGLALGIGLTISLELLPLAAALLAILGLRWLRNDEARAWLVNAMGALSLTTAALYLVTRGVPSGMIACDVLSAAHVAAIAAAAAGTWLMGRLPPHNAVLAMTGFGAVGIIAILAFNALAAPCMGSTFNTLDPVVRTFWFERVLEGRPIWAQGLALPLQLAVIAVVGLYANARLYAQATGTLRRFWFEYGLLLAASTLIAIFVFRAGAVTCALAAVPFGWQFREWLTRLRTMRGPLQQTAVAAGIFAVVMPTAPIALLTKAVPSQAAAQPLPKVKDCKVELAADALSGRTQRIMAPIDLGPALLLHSSHSVSASPHHRGNAGMHETITTFASAPDEARAAIVRGGYTMVALCPDLVEPALYREANPQGLAARLMENKVPEWLEPVETPDQSGLKLWRVR